MRGTALFIGLLLTALAVGCGGDDDPEPQGDAPVAGDSTPTFEEPADDSTGEPADEPEEESTDTSPEGDREDNGGDDEDRRSPERGERESRERERSDNGDERRRPRRRRPARPKSREHARAVAAGDRICADFRRDAAEAQRQSSNTSERLRRLRELTATAVERLRAMRAPEDRREILRDYINAIESQIPLLAELQRAAERRDRQAMSDAARRIREVGETAQELARRYGFHVCGSG